MKKSPLSMALLLAFAAGAQATPASDQWRGGGPFATGQGDLLIDSLTVSADGRRLFAGTGSGTVFSYAYADNTAPVLSNVGVSGTAQTTTTLAATSNEAATGYWLVVARDATAPTVAQVKAGIGYGGAVVIVAHGSGAMNGNAPASFAIAGLTAAVSYDLYVVAEDLAGNLSAAPSKIAFTTVAQPASPSPGSPSTPPTSIVVNTGATSTLSDSTPVIAHPGSTLLISGSSTTNGASIALPLPAPGGVAAAVSMTLNGQTLALTPNATGTTLSVRTISVNGVATQVLALASGSVTVTASQPGAPLLAIGSGSSHVVLTAHTAGASATGTLDGGTGQTVVAVSNGIVILPANAFSTGKTKSATSSAALADNKLYAGELAAIDSDGKIVSIRLGTPAGGAAGDALKLNLADNLGFTGKVPQLDATSARLGQRLQTALAQAVGATLVDVQNNGVLALDIGASRLFVLPLGEVEVDPTRSDGVVLNADGTVSASFAHIVVRLASSVADLGQLARDFAASVPGTTLQVGSNGTLVVTLAGQNYVLQPGWISQTGAPSGFSVRAGQLNYGQSGRAFGLNAGVADCARLAAFVEQQLPGATLASNADGTVMLGFSGQSWTLVPAMLLKTAPTNAPPWWIDSGGTLQLRNGDGSVQGFSLR